jgi:lysophospholipase L1-like esterase
VGRNGEPNVKIDDFARYVDEAGNGPDIAFFKFCYADANADTDVRAVFDHYRQVLSDLETRHPRTMFIHVTMALTTVQTGWRVPLKRLLGRSIDGYADNARRNQYNDLLRAEYAGKASFIDLAAIESTYPDGSRMSFSQDGETYYSLAPANTSDGGHLSGRGRRAVAEQLLALLAELTSRRG